MHAIRTLLRRVSLLRLAAVVPFVATVLSEPLTSAGQQLHIAFASFLFPPAAQGQR